MADSATAQETIFALREQIAKMEGKPLPALSAARQAETALHPERQGSKDRKRLPFSIPALDEALDGGIPMNGLTEIRTGLMGDAGSISGFTLALAAYVKAAELVNAPVLWIGDVVSTLEAGAPYAPGIKRFGLRPKDMLYASPRSLEDALWLAETAVGSGALAATILELRGNLKHFGLTESRRLSLRAKTVGRPLFLMRHAGEEEASSASFRFLVEPAPASERRLTDGSLLGGSVGHPVFRLTLEKSRNPAPLSVLLEWNPNDRQFSLGRQAREAFAYRNTPAHHGTRLPASADRQGRPQALGHVVALERAS